LSEPGSLLQISFHPSLSAIPFPLPPSANLVLCITNSLAPHALASSAKTQYNLRVVECFIAARILADAWGQKHAMARPSLMDVVAACAGKTLQERLQVTLDAIDSVLGGEKAETGWTVEEMRSAASLTPHEFDQVYLEWLEGRSIARCELTRASRGNSLPFVQASTSRPGRIT
jgi:galactokinase